VVALALCRNGSNNKQKYIFHCNVNKETYAALTHAGLTTRYRMKNLYKNILVFSRSRDIWFMKTIESLLKTAGMKFEI